MLFTQLNFWLFFSIVFVVTHLLAQRPQNCFLLFASLIFYGAWDWLYLVLMLVSTVITFVSGLFAGPSQTEATRKIAASCGVVANLGILGIFKYYDFFVESLAGLFQIAPQTYTRLLLSTVLPIGISFYTFQAIGYIIDVRNNRVVPVTGIITFSLFHTFFPQVVAGPIERAGHLVPQIICGRSVDFAAIKSGMLLIAWGLFQKIVVADSLAQPVEAVFRPGADPNGPQVYAALLVYAFQIYGDFAGYTDIARGTARLLGFELLLNFNLPYFSRNPSEFWRKWHISLSTWLRDYLYIPLGGSRKGSLVTYRNLLITMGLGGLWHGAAWHFVLWGLYHGGGLVVHRLATAHSRIAPRRPHGGLITCLKILSMFHFTLFGWMLFRVQSMQQLRQMGGALVSDWRSFEAALSILAYAAPVVLPLLLYQIWEYHSGRLEVINDAPWPAQVLFFSLCFWSVIMLNRGGAAPFIYFQF